MTSASPNQSKPDDAGAASPSTGVLLDDAQEKWLKRAVVGMTVVLVVGFFLLIGRVIYLARGDTRQVATALADQTTLLPEVHAALPAGAVVKGVSLSGSRALILHATPGKPDEMSVLDLVTGKILSHIVFDAVK